MNSFSGVVPVPVPRGLHVPAAHLDLRVLPQVHEVAHGAAAARGQVRLEAPAGRRDLQERQALRLRNMREKVRAGRSVRNIITVSSRLANR